MTGILWHTILSGDGARTNLKQDQLQLKSEITVELKKFDFKMEEKNFGIYRTMEVQFVVLCISLQ